MAKGSQTGVIKGKRGNVVFYKIANSNNKERQGSREYVADVANPMTIPQAVQRVKLTPALRFYSAFKDILNHSWEGVSYGGESYRLFLKRAMNLQSGYPFALKGLATALPGKYQVSEGSLSSIKYEFDRSGNLNCEVLSLDSGDTFGEWSQGVIDASFGTIQNGDQITIIRMIGDDIRYNWTNTIRFVLDTASTEQASTKFGLLGLSISPDGVIEIPGSTYSTFGAAIIVSRPVVSQTTGAVEWKRSTQFFNVNYAEPSVVAYFTQDYYNAAIRSYTKSSNRNIQSEWYLNQGKAKLASEGNIPDAPVIQTVGSLIWGQILDEDVQFYGKWVAGVETNQGKFLIAGNGVISDAYETKHIYTFGALNDEPGENVDTINQVWVETSKNYNLNNLLYNSIAFTGIISVEEAENMLPGVTLNLVTEPLH